MRNYYISILLLVTLNTGYSQINFTPAINYYSGNKPTAILNHDINGDGFLDLIVSNIGDPKLSVHFGDGSGYFAPPISHAFTGEGLIKGDFNNDGKIDIAGYGGKYLSILYTDLTGWFSTTIGTYINTTKDIDCFSIGDFNADGILDIACGHSGLSRISSLLGDGLGGFTLNTSNTLPLSPDGIVCQDFTGDGKVDIAALEKVNGEIRWFAGDGVGGFAFSFAPSLTLGTYSTTLNSWDLNSDGKKDLVVLGNGGLAVILSNGSGGFLAPNYFTFTGAAPIAVDCADYSGDGKLDLAVANYNSSNISVFLGNGAGVFNSAINFGVGTRPKSITSGDFNGDGMVDIATANYDADSISVLINNFTTGNSYELSIADSKLIIEPNPSDGEFRIDFGNIFDLFDVTISDLSGRTVFKKEKVVKGEILNIKTQLDGFYFVNIQSGKNRAHSKILLNKNQ